MPLSTAEPVPIMDRIELALRERRDRALPAEVLILGARQWRELAAHLETTRLLLHTGGLLHGMVLWADERDDALEVRSLDGD